MLSKMARVLFLGLLPLMVGCPGPLEPGYNPNQPPDQNSLGFGYLGEIAAVNGQWGIVWGIDRAPAVTAPTRIRFQGPGMLMVWEGEFENRKLVPMDLTKEYPGAGGIYRPPTDAPTEGAVVKVGCEVFSPFTKRWEKSPDYEIRVTRKNTPMDFFTEKGGLPAGSATVRAGESVAYALVIQPRPAMDPQRQSTLVPPAGYSGDPGSLNIEPIPDGVTWRYTYTAPSAVLSSMDVIVRTTAYDPWVQQTRTVDFTLHVVP